MKVKLLIRSICEILAVNDEGWGYESMIWIK